jgi:hypothetical protein
MIDPLHVRVEPGQALAVTWDRGETGYSLALAS